MKPQRLVLDYRTGELIIHTLYRTQDGPTPGTKARCKEVTELAREGLRHALEALNEAHVDVVGTSGFTRRGRYFGHDLTGCRQASEGSLVDVARTEAREPDAELVRMIERRSRKGEADPDEREELWKESVRRYNARRREEMRAA